MRCAPLAVLLAVLGLGLGAGDARAQQVLFPSPFAAGARADVNELGQAVVAWAGPRGVRAVTGDRTGGFAGVSALTSTPDTTAAPLAAIDGHGDALVVWETTRTVPGSGCSTCGPRTLSTGVWAALRPAGAAFGAPVQLAGPARDVGGDFQRADPRLAMAASGEAVIAWSDADGAGGAFRAAGAAIGPPQRVAPAGVVVRSVAIGDTGEALLGDLDGRVAIRPAGGAFGAPEPLPESRPATGVGARLAANARGDAIAAYEGTRGQQISRRPAGGAWTAPEVISGPLGSGVRAVALPDSGPGVVAYIQTTSPTLPHTVLFAAFSAPPAALGQEAVSRDDLDADMSFDGAGLDADPAGDAALGWERYNSRDILFGRRVAQVGSRRSGGAFAAPVTLTAPDAIGHAAADTADVAIDGRGELLATWADQHATEVRLNARWFTASAAGPAIVLDTVAQGRPVLPPGPGALGHEALVDVRHRLRASARGRVAVTLRCVSNDGRACSGMLTLAYGTKQRTAGRARFRLAAGRARRVSVALRRPARAALLRLGELAMTATARTTAPAGANGRARAPLSVSAPAGAKRGTLRVTSRALPSTATYTEGAIQFAAVYRAGGAKPVVTGRSRGGALRFAHRLAPGGYRIDSWTRTCSGNCGVLDAPSLRCTRTLRIGAGAVRRYEVRTRVGRRCRIVTAR